MDLRETLADLTARHGLRVGDRIAADGMSEIGWYSADMAYRYALVRWWGEPDGTEDVLRLVDILRRAGAHEAALAMAARLDGAALDENSAAILGFQRARIADGDTGRHGIGSALRPPARRPHVAHGRKAEAGGLWRRLFGA